LALAGKVVTAGALHTQREHARYHPIKGNKQLMGSGVRLGLDAAPGSRPGDAAMQGG